jgi:hypothetical protein
VDLVELEANRLYDADPPDAEEQRALLAYLMSEGVTLDDMIESKRVGRLALGVQRFGEEPTLQLARDAPAHHPILPTLRAAVASGTVPVRDGDCFGPVVNLRRASSTSPNPGT